MNDKYQRCKNKWESQRISKRFKNRHLNDEYRNKYNAPKANINFCIENCKNESTENIDDIYPSNDIILPWNCQKCTYYNVESNWYCTICELPFNLSKEQNEIIMADYLQPILNQIEINHDDFDEEMQFVIELSLSLENNTTDSDDNDDTSSINTAIINNKKRKTKKRGISFASYWHEMSEYNTVFQKNLKYIIKQNQLRMKNDKDGNNTLWKGHGNVNCAAFDIIKNYPELMSSVPSTNNVYDWLGVHWNIKDFSIKNIINSYVLQKFMVRGKVKKGHLQIVYHGTQSSNDESIINKGLIVGGTKGISIRHGAAYGTGVYCTPNLQTASYYQKGSLFICLVRSNKCKKSGNIFVVPNDSDILPIYLANISYHGAYIANNSIFKFMPGWKPLNFNVKANKERRIKRKWNNFHKLQY